MDWIRVSEWFSEDARRERMRRGRFVFLGLALAMALVAGCYSWVYSSSQPVRLAECSVSTNGLRAEIVCPGAGVVRKSTKTLRIMQLKESYIYVDASAIGRTLMRQSEAGLLGRSVVVFGLFFIGQRLQSDSVRGAGSRGTTRRSRAE